MKSLAIQRLNMDNSWMIHWNETKFVLDPWLVGSEIDGFRWFNEQWHATKPLSIEDIQGFDAIIVSQPYSDHCHTETLKKLNAHTEVYGAKKAATRIKKEWNEAQINLLEANQWNTFKDFSIMSMKSEKWIHSFYDAIIIANADNDAIFYASHGFIPSDGQLRLLKKLNIRLLITTFTYFKLPFFLGGKVNPGYEAALKLADQLDAKAIVNTHDEQKPGKGLVLKIAKTKYQDPNAVIDSRFLLTNDYHIHQL